MSPAPLRAPRRAPWLGLLALLALLRPALAEEPAPAGAPREAGKARVAAALDVVERHAVLVTLSFQKNLHGEEHDALPPDPRSTSERFRAWRMTMVVPGFVVRDHRTVLISDLWIAPGALASVTVRPLTGAPVAARVRGFLARAEALVLETEADLPLAPVPFPAAGAAPAEAVLAGSVAEGARGIESWVDGLGAVRRRVGSPNLAFGSVDAPTGGMENDPGLRTVDLVLGPGAAPIGLRFGGGMDVDEGVWRGADVLADREVPLASLEERERTLAQARTRARVEVRLRTTKRDDREDGGFGGDDEDDRFEHWGFAVAPDLLVVVGRIEPDAVRRIESVRWKVDDGPGEPASYAGRVRGLDAYLVRVPGAAFAPLPAEQPPVPGIGGAVLMHHTAWRGGARRDQVEYNRVLGWGRRYGDHLDLALERSVEEGSLLLDLEGRVLGVCARLDPEDKEDTLGGGGRAPRRDRGGFSLRAVLFAEVGPPAALAQDPDTRVMPQEEEASKRLPWLGVETTGLTKGVADLLDISAATRDGRRGLLVGRVYPASPAAAAGIVEGDILLSAKRTEGPGSALPPVDLAEARGGWFNPWAMFEDGEDAAAQVWPSQDNAVNRLLKTWGEGTPYELTWLRSVGAAREPRTAVLRVELSPPTYDSAPRARDEGTGLSVRDLTFEVRAALRLAPTAPGVIVARVEPGSPAAQARIARNELLQEVDGAPVASSADLARALEAARTAGKEGVRVVVRRLDKTRLVDLGLAPREDAGGPAPAGEADAGPDDAPR